MRQIGVPALLEPLSEKRAFSGVFGLALITTLIMYSVLALAAVAFFGTSVDPSCNLHWRSYAHRTIGLAVALFPALDTVSVFPMNVSFLANNVMAVVFDERWHSGNVSRSTRVFFRMACLLVRHRRRIRHLCSSFRCSAPASFPLTRRCLLSCPLAFWWYILFAATLCVRGLLPVPCEGTRLLGDHRDNAAVRSDPAAPQGFAQSLP